VATEDGPEPESGGDLFESVYGKNEALRWVVRWRVFFMACAELFGYKGGREWIVSHYLFEARR